MTRGRKIALVAVIVIVGVGGWIAYGLQKMLRGIPEAYAAWDPGTLLIEYMKQTQNRVLPELERANRAVDVGFIALGPPASSDMIVPPVCEHRIAKTSDPSVKAAPHGTGDIPLPSRSIASFNHDAVGPKAINPFYDSRVPLHFREGPIYQ